MNKELTFYQQPFHAAKYGTWVYDQKYNFVFQFENEAKKMKEKIIFSINAYNHDPIPGLNLTVGSDPTEIHNHGELFITIRGWGNLTGIGAHNFDADKAAKIQDDFRDWLIYKMSV